MIWLPFPADWVYNIHVTQNTCCNKPPSVFESNAYVNFCKMLALFLLPLGLLFISFIKLERTVSAKGIIESTRQIVVTSPVKDTVVENIYSFTGDTVKKNERILRLYDLSGAGDQMEIIKIRAGELEKLLAVQEGAVERGTISRKEYEQLENEYKKETIRLNEYRKKQDLLVSTAPFDGKIVKMIVEQYDRVDIGTPLYEISADSNLIVKTWVSEQVCTLVKKGQKVYIKSNMYNYLWYSLFRGEVFYVSDFGQKRPGSDEIVFEVKISISDGRDLLKVNSSVRCDIVRDKVSVIIYLFDKAARK
ncbi:MAG: hypothetical protein A2096_03170 [Spirochaetes bacterium GWF1_41_5]|nr:MAG: hypothetical protein A2096_03170 [Spirochaetes bacterium GWF1_41_5]